MQRIAITTSLTFQRVANSAVEPQSKAMNRRTILTHIVEQLPERPTQDQLLDAFEGEVDEKRVASAANMDQRRVEAARRGCNRQFKDSYLAHGWDIQECIKFAQGVDPKKEKEKGVPGYCVRQTSARPSNSEMGEYCLKKEIAYNACQQTVGTFQDEIASFLARTLYNQKITRDLIGEACTKHARCLERKRSMSLEQRSKLLQEHRARVSKAAKKSKTKKPKANMSKQVADKRSSSGDRHESSRTSEL